MKKLSELTAKELKQLYYKNKELASQAYEDAYSNNMWCQEMEAKEIGTGVFAHNDHYSSFYLTTPTTYGAKAPEKVAGVLEAGFLNEPNRKLYNRLCELNAKMEDATEWDEDRPEYEEMIEVCDRLAEGITEQLRDYENISDDEVLDLFIQNAQMGYMSDWETDGTLVYETIIKTYK